MESVNSLSRQKKKCKRITMILDLCKQNISFLGGIEKYSDFMTTLRADENYITSLNPLTACHNLEELYLSYNCDLKSLSGMESCVNLKRILINYCVVQSLKPLINCTKLSYMDCIGNDIKCLDGMQNCARLGHFDCENNHRLNTLKGLPDVRANLLYFYFEGTILSKSLRKGFFAPANDKHLELSGTQKFKKIRENLDCKKFYISWLFPENTIKLYDFF